MAKVKNPLMSQEAHGAVGGLEFRLTRSGSIVGDRSLATPTRTSRATSYAAHLGKARAAWTLVSPLNKKRWASVAPPGMSAFNFFQLAYARSSRLTLLITAESPVLVRPARISNFAISEWIPSSRILRATWAHSAGANNWVYIYFHGSYRPLTSPPMRGFRFLTGTNTTVTALLCPVQPRYLDVWIRVDTLHRTNFTLLQRQYVHLEHPFA